MTINIKNNNYTSKIFELQLGDIISIIDHTDTKLNNNIFLIDYIDNSGIKLINVEDLSIIELNLNNDRTIYNSTITNIIILSRNDNPGYAKQHNLVPNTWINIYFRGELPGVITGEITNIEEDMIEIKTYPNNDIIYLNFDYKGIPKNIPIELIEIREKLVKPNIIEDEEKIEQISDIDDLNAEYDDEYNLQKQQQIEVKPLFREFIIKPNQVQYGREDYGPIVQYVDVDTNRQRYSIEEQTNDLLDDLLSTIPNIKRSDTVLNNIHTIIERFTQLRSNFSIFDEYGNVLNSFVKKANWKPLTTYFEKFNQKLYWILPNVTNCTKSYDTDNDDNIEFVDQEEELKSIQQILTNYKTNNLQNSENKYSSLFTELVPYFTPFSYIDSENKYDIIYEKEVETDLPVILYDINADNSTTLFTNYTTGLTKLNATSFSGNKMIYNRVKLTNSDILEIKSFITLPEPTIRFSRINLPNTSILDKSNLNINFLTYWKLFNNNKLNINNIIVDNVEEDLNYNENTFVNNIKNFVLSLPENAKKLNYSNFINTIIPTTRILFNLMKKYIIGKLSIVDVVSYLEPFLIYSDDLTYTQYKVITKFIYEKISNYNKEFIEKGKNLNEFKKNNEKFKSKNSQSKLFLAVPSKINLNNDVAMGIHNLNHKNEIIFTNSELVKKTLLDDFGMLNATKISINNLSLIFPTDINKILENDNKQLEKNILIKTKKDTCKNYIIAKQYYELSDLENDNDTEIYFDKQYDNTNYGVLDKYSRDLLNMPTEQFMKFLIINLKSSMNLNDFDSEYLAETLINGSKRVLNGNYAILNYISSNTDSDLVISYYIRKNNIWVLDDSVDKNGISDNQSILCNLQVDCINSPNKINDICENTQLFNLKTQKSLLKNMLSEFDNKYETSKINFENNINKQLEYSLKIMPILNEIKYNELVKYNNKKYKIVSQNNELDVEHIMSPYAKLRDIILGQTDFIKKQNYIIKFVNSFTRHYYNETTENEHWLYCTKTNVKLMPVFFFKLATEYLISIDSYNNAINKLIQEIGARSDDGDSWVDKYSGYVITKIEFEEEEEYNENGFLIKSRDILEKSSGDMLTGNMLTTNKINLKKINNPEIKIIYNIITELSIVMGINIESQYEFIINIVTSVIKENLPNEENYKIKFKEAINKGKLMPSFKELYNSFLLYNTVGMFLISMQTHIPSIKTRKTYPGCIQSFNGYPFEGAGDLQSINYIACILYKLKTKEDPWSVLSRKKETYISEKIKGAIDMYLLRLPDVVRKFNEKTDELLRNPEILISDEYKISNWKNFLPPLIEFKIKNLLNVSEEFKKTLFDFKKASFNQNEKKLIIESKIIKFSLAIQEQIQNVINSQKLLLITSGNSPYVENACCNENNKYSTIEYFINKNNDITTFNDNVTKLTDVLYEYHKLSNANLLTTKINAKNVYPTLPTEFSEQTIYAAFISYCHFKTTIPINELLLPLCNIKPEYINNNDSIEEIIRKLKQDGKTYSTENFLRLLQLISRQQIVNVPKTLLNYSQLNRLDDLLILFSKQSENIIEPELQTLLKNLIHNNNDVDTSNKNINNYLIKRNVSMKNNIIEFLTKNLNIPNNKVNKIKNFINNLNVWEGEKTINNNETNISNDYLYNSIQFFKTYIQNLSVTFPNIILNMTYYEKNMNFSKDLSSKHSKDLYDIIKETLLPLHTFYNDPILTTILQTIKQTSNNVLILSHELRCFCSKGDDVPQIFNERTSKFLFEHLFLKVIINYVELAQDKNQIVKEVIRGNDDSERYNEENNYLIMNSVTYNLNINQVEPDTNINSGNQKQLKQKTAELLFVYIQIMNNHKEEIDTSYELIMDRIFKLKEKEKDTFTDRLQKLNDEERDIDTILKINKLGIWNKGLQKGLTKYVGSVYDEETATDKEIENILGNIKNDNFQNMDTYIEDLMEQKEIDNQIERENYDMRHMTEDYTDGDYEGYENENDDYNDYN